MNKAGKRWAIGALVAALAGYVAGLLTAPKSGKETREDIKNAAVTGLAEAERRLKSLHTQLSTLLGEGKKKAALLQGKAREELEAVIDKTQVAKEKAREILSALHEGDADDKDLQKAIDEATKAVNHLKSYLNK